MIYRDVVNVRKLNISSAMGDVHAAEETHSVCASPDSEDDKKKLWDAYQWKDEIILRCSSIEARGFVTNVRYDGPDTIYELNVDHIGYQKSRKQPARELP